MTDKVFPMTVEGKAELEAELEELRTTKRDEVVERIKIARGYGDLSENSEYESARDEQAIIEGRIKVIENMLHNAEIIEKSDNDDEVSFGSTVTFKEVPGDEEETYTIVGKAEADPFEGKISNESPIGQALLGAKVGDQVNIASEADPFTIEILKIENK